MSTRLQRQLQFILEIDRLKNVLRRTYVLHEPRRENSAEHSWQLALMAVVLAEHANRPIDLERTVKMVLIHDIVEVDAGDTFTYDDEARADKAEREERAARRLFGLLPGDQAAEFRSLWDEFERAETPESRFANALDRLMPLLHNALGERSSWADHRVRREQVLERCAPIAHGSQSLWAMAEQLIAEAVTQGKLAE